MSTYGRLKVNAWHPAVRTEVCDHTHMPYRGAIPCTGGRACTMCGAHEDELREEQTPERAWPRNPNETTEAYLARTARHIYRS